VAENPAVDLADNNAQQPEDNQDNFHNVFNAGGQIRGGIRRSFKHLRYRLRHACKNRAGRIFTG
jgi:hypothetical protein